MTAVVALTLLVLGSVATGGRFLVVQGGSMRPALHSGDLLIVRPCSAGVRPGDVINYQPRTGSASVTHRVVRVRTEGEGLRLVTKGDANRRPDEIVVRGSSVRGTVVAVLPRVGTVARWLRTPAGFAVGVAVPAILLVVGEARRLRALLRCARSAKT